MPEAKLSLQVHVAATRRGGAGGRIADTTKLEKRHHLSATRDHVSQKNAFNTLAAANTHTSAKNINESVQPLNGDCASEKKTNPQNAGGGETPTVMNLP